MLAAFRALSVPRFADEADLRLKDSRLGERAFWSQVVQQLIHKHGATAELRIAWSDDVGKVTVEIRFHGQGTPALVADIRHAAALLPSQFRWRAVNTTAPDTQVRIARIVRRVEQVDLPGTSPLMLRDSGLNLLREGAENGAPARGQSGQASRLEAMQRELPDFEAVQQEITERRFCVPILAPLNEARARMRVLFEALYRTPSAVVSICLHPIDLTDLQRAELVSMHWQRFLAPHIPELVSYGSFDSQTLQTAFSRYSLSSGRDLVYASMRVAAADGDTSIGIANVLVESLGGARSFRVVAPRRDASSDLLVARDLDTPSSAWNAGRLRAWREALTTELRVQGVDLTDIDMVDFVGAMPHVYNLPEIDAMLALPTADEEGLPGMESHPVPPFVLPSIALDPVLTSTGELAKPRLDRLRIGMVERPGRPSNDADERARYASYAWHSIDPLDLTKHAFIVGSTGSGKTMATTFLVRELARLGVPLMIIEPVKAEYFDNLRQVVPTLRRLRFEGRPDGTGPGADFFKFDPLRVPLGVTVAKHCSYLKSCFEAAFAMNEFLALLLENGLRAYYQEPLSAGGCGLTKFSRGGPAVGKPGPSGADKKTGIFPSFQTFRHFFDDFLDRELASIGAGRNASDLQQIKDAFKRRFANLADGVVGESFRLADALHLEAQVPQTYDLFPHYLSLPLVVELDGIPDADHKALVMAFLLSRLFEHRQAEDFMAREAGKSLPRKLRHFLVVEEAHRLLLSGSAGASRGSDTIGDGAKSKAVQLFVDMLAEVRAFGQGLGIVEQIPTKIVSEAVKNTNLKIMLRLTARDDREYLGEAMNFTDAQKQFVTSLKVERGRQINFVAFEEGVEQPLLLSLPLPRGGEHLPYDEFFS